jgi:hypothetical protein
MNKSKIQEAIALFFIGFFIKVPINLKIGIFWLFQYELKPSEKIVLQMKQFLRKRFIIWDLFVSFLHNVLG